MSSATEAYDYKSVEYSGARAPSRWAQTNKWQFGFSQWLTLTPEMTFGKHDGVISQVPDHYELILDDARDIQVILYDTAAHRAFQTDGEELILHALLHRWVDQGADKTGGSTKSHLGFLEPERPTSTSEAMLNAEEVVFRRHPSGKKRSKPLFFKDVVKQVHSTLDAMFRETQKHNDAFGRFDMKKATTLNGWEYMELVRHTKNPRPKSVSLKGPCGRWQAYARDINAVALLGANFGDVFQPLWDWPFGCKHFRTLPQDRSYLAVKTETLRHLFERQRCSKDQMRLTTSGLMLQGTAGFLASGHFPCISFESCSEGTLMCLASKTILGKKPSLLPLDVPGLVVIGECKRNSLKVPHQEGKDIQLDRWPVGQGNTPATSSYSSCAPERASGTLLKTGASGSGVIK